MLPVFLLLLFGALQICLLPQIPALAWAAVFFSIIFLAGITVFHGETSLVATCALGFYAWGYFILLRRWQNKARSVRITLYLAGALFPLTLIWLFLANI